MGFKFSNMILYLLVLVPMLTEYLVHGGIQRQPRDLITEIVVTILVAVVVIYFYKQKREIEFLALHDELTGIGNRRMFNLNIEREVLRANRSGRDLCLIFFDIDGFKSMNDSLGHQAGDEILVKFASALSNFGRRGIDSCYRFGGDEFALLLTEIEDDHPADIQRRLTRDLDLKLPEGVAASKGIVYFKHGESIDSFLNRADREMYNRKRDVQLV